MNASTSRPSTDSVTGSMTRVAPARESELAAPGVDVGDDHFAGSERAGGLGDDDADRTGAGDEHAGSGSDLGALACPDADRQRLDERGRFVGDVVGDVEREVALDGDEL